MNVATNRLTRDVSSATGFDLKYIYDGLDRLSSMDQGTLSSGSIASKNFGQEWTLDQLGNWATFAETDAMSTTLDQDRAHNDVNETGAITASTGANWADPAYDAAGNMTTMPQPDDVSQAFDAEYDAWNRLVSLSTFGMSPVTIEANQFDGLHRRIVRDEDGDDVHHFAC